MQQVQGAFPGAWMQLFGKRLISKVTDSGLLSTKPGESRGG